VIVIDCSALVDALTAAEDANSLRARISGEDLHAPALLDFEVVAALRAGIPVAAQRFPLPRRLHRSR